MKRPPVGIILGVAVGALILAVQDKSSAGSSQGSSTVSDPNSTAARLKAINDYEVKTGLPPDYLYPYAINSGYALGSVWYNLETGAPGAFVVPNTSPGSKGNLLQPISEWNNYYPGVNIPRRP
jgi:hypothetical protein